ncbi:glutathione S-transferase family protein [Sulfitobacter sp.]|uniref:glutathione S-transferase family protein n=1 Tax=Sulfitobacter sp. TaxID=1903071 RepID=UPI003EF1C24F
MIEKQRRKIHPVSGGPQPDMSVPHTNAVELYSNAFSHCSRKARLVLAELGIETKHHPIDLIETGWYQTISPAYLKVNPSGLVPTLVHNGHPVFESDDILSYAQDIAGPNAPQLVPTDPERLAKMNHWLSFCAISSEDAMAGMEARAGACVPGLTLPMFVSAIRYIPLRNILIGFLFHFDKKRPAMFTASKLFGLRRMMSQKPLRDIMHASRDHMTLHLKTLNHALIDQGGHWILGDHYSLADVSIACVLLRLDETGWLNWYDQNSDIAEVMAYYERLKSRFAWDAAITQHAHPVVTKAKDDLAKATSSDPAMAKLIYGSALEAT